MEDNNITRPYRGLHTDNSPQDQPKNTHRFGLNGVRESEVGDENFGSNEESNEPCSSLPDGFIPIGKEYIGNGQSAIFLTNPNALLPDIIGITDDECNYETHVNANLGFQVSNQVDATYRLRRGCERTIYFTDNLNKPRTYNFDKPEDFQNNVGDWDVDKFNLFKTYDKVPTFDDVELLESGQLPSGSYNFSIQYLDEDLNPTEWITTTDTVIIYNDDFTSKAFGEIRGSTNKKTDYQDFGVTNKAIRLTIGNLDTGFPFYRIAIIEANNGSGAVSRVVYSQETSTRIQTFTYAGENAFTEGTLEEVQQFTTVIETAEHIEQIENRLILSNTQGKQLNYCKLQKYASKIKSQLVTEEIILNDVQIANNQKRGQVHLEKVGYMPGEIYSFGIVYVFEDGTLSPVYHIPGRNETYLSDMSENNKLTDTFYTDNNNCSDEDYWGVDGQGEGLVGTPVRHHRFPLRSEVNKPLFVKNGQFGNPVTITTNSLNIIIEGEIDTAYTEDTITYAVTYEIDGNAQAQESGTIDTDTYDSLEGSSDEGIATSTGNIDNVIILERNPATGTFDAVVGGVGPYSGLNYSNQVVTSDSSTSIGDDSIYTSEIFGIKFSDIDIPDLADTNGERVISYYIVRNERKEENKSILDTGVMLPLIVEQRAGVSKFVAHGHLLPQTTRIKEDVFALIHPEHKFNNREYRNTSQLIKEGEFVVQETTRGERTLEDVQPGTSYDSDAHKRRERDTDGFSLHVLNRNSTVNYVRVESVLAEDAEIKETFYLNALFSKTVTDINNDRKDIFNVSADNKIGIIQLNKTLTIGNRLPYVIMKREIGNPYAGFRVLPYYKEIDNPSILLNNTGNEISIFNGDSYISSMKYMSSMFYDVRIRNRREKSGILNTIIGVLAAIAGAVLIITGVGAAAGIALIGFGVSQIATGIKKDQIARVYQDLYEQGLKDTVNDNFTDETFGPNPSDDTIQWFHDSITDLWFESSVNMNWRMGATIGLTDFLSSPTGYDQEQVLQYCVDKVTIPDSENDDGRTYQGFAKAELYEVNPDYARRDKEKIFFHLGLEYDCCSDCIEDFPHRNHFSEQSFQEELTDNYRTFLPNNYRDIEGENGEITNIFRIQNNLYIHTEEALWHLPQNIQERVTGDVVSFIGTGSFFSIPPRLILDGENGNSAGTQHKWSTLKTPHGVFFVSERQGVIYQFNGNNLQPISAQGMFNWFKNNITLQTDRNYYLVNQRQYPYRDNPSNPFGSGFISVYDSRKERVIFTKKDSVFGSNIIGDNNDYEVCVENGELIVFQNFNQIISDRETNGWNYEGIEDCRLKFSRVTTQPQQVEQVSKVPNEADIHVFFDTSGSFGQTGDTCLNSINQAVDNWLTNFGNANPDWNGQVYKYNDSTEQWVNYASVISNQTYGGNTAGRDIIVISFCNESSPAYHGGNFDSTISTPTAQFNTDYNNFVNTVYPSYNSFIGIHYPIAFGNGAGSCGTGGGNLPSSKTFLMHSIAALFGVEMSGADVASEFTGPNPAFTTAEWNTVITALQTSNPYPDNGLRNFGWTGKWDRAADASGNVINDEQFNQDIDELLQANITTEVVTVDVPVTEYEYEEGTVIDDPELLNNSWTISYSLKSNPNSWQYWHSYLPSFYIHTPEKFQSWIPDSNFLWRHNKKYNYQNFYGKRHPFIIEYVSLNNPLTTKIWDYLRLITEAKRYDENFNEFVDERFITFNKGLFYNSRQSSGVLNLMVKDTKAEEENYLLQQVQDLEGDTIIIDRNERDWTLNELRDVRVNYSEPMFNSKLENLQDDYYIDKVVNENSIDYDKDWTQLESFRDKYLVIRLIFDTFDDIKLILNYSVENEKQSFR